MAVGEPSGAPGAPRRVVSSSAAARRKPEGAGVPEADAVVEAEPLVKEADPELERLLAEVAEVERRVHDHSATHKFHTGDGDRSVDGHEGPPQTTAARPHDGEDHGGQAGTNR